MNSLKRNSSGWAGKCVGAHKHGFVTLMLQLGVDVRGGTKYQLKGTPCEKIDCPRRVKSKLNKPFWQRCEYEIRDAYIAARKKYLEGVKELHPDHGGDPTKLATLNGMWEFVENSFAKRGFL